VHERACVVGTGGERSRALCIVYTIFFSAGHSSICGTTFTDVVTRCLGRVLNHVQERGPRERVCEWRGEVGEKVWAAAESGGIDERPER
jgi:hypothetical protein